MKRLLAALVCGLLALSACSGDSSSSADPPPSPSPVTSGTPSTGGVESESPENFVRRWVALSNAMQNSGETKEYLALSGKCRPCRAVADQVSGYFDAGGYVKTDGWSINSIKVTKPSDSGQVTATIDVTAAPTEYKASASSQVQRLKGGSVVELMTLTEKADSWTVLDLEQQAQ